MVQCFLLVADTIIGVALPSKIVEKKNSGFVLALYAAVFIIAVYE